MGQGDNNEDPEERPVKQLLRRPAQQASGPSRSFPESVVVRAAENRSAHAPTVAGYPAHAAVPSRSRNAASAPAERVERTERPQEHRAGPEATPSVNQSQQPSVSSESDKPATGWDQGVVVRPRTVAPSAPTQFGSAADAWTGRQAPVVPQRDSAHQPTLQFGAVMGGAAAQQPPGQAHGETPAANERPVVQPNHAASSQTYIGAPLDPSQRSDDTPLVAVHHTLLREHDNTPLVVSVSDDESLDYEFQAPGSPDGPRAHAADEPEAPAIMFERSVPSVMIDPSLEAEARAKMGGGTFEESSEELPLGRPSVPKVARRAPSHWAQQSTMMLSEGGSVPSAFANILRWVISRSATGLLVLSGLAAVCAVVADRFLEFRGIEGEEQDDYEVEDSLDGIVEIPGVASADYGAPSDTLIVSEPAGAEVIHGGAVVGRTPVLVQRSVENGVYLLRKPGFQPQVVQVKPSTPSALNVTLRALGAGAPD